MALPDEGRSSVSQRGGILLDRDGVINPMWYDPDHGTRDSPSNPDEFSLLPGVAEAIRLINDRGLPTAVVSNQPGVAKGKLSLEVLDAITAKMTAELSHRGARVDRVLYCLHHPDAALPQYRVSCDCRKPRPGLLLQASLSLNLDLRSSVMIGDGFNDVQAGRAAGCRTVWIGRRKCDDCQFMNSAEACPDVVAGDLLEAVRAVAQ